MKKNAFIGVALATLTSGCAIFSPPTIVTKYDAQGNITEKIETRESVLNVVAENCKDSTVVLFREAYIVGLQLSPADTTTETIMSFLCMYAHKNTAFAAIHPKQENMDKIVDLVRALKSMDKVSASTTGISSGN